MAPDARKTELVGIDSHIDAVEAEIGLYADPVVYDILHTPGTADESAGLLIAERFGRIPADTTRCWLEPACGSGRLLRLARSRGIDTIGFDINQAMIEYASARARRTQANAHETYFTASMTDFASQVHRPVTFAFNLINTIRHLGSDEEMFAHFDEISRVLAPGSVYCVGVSLSQYLLEQPSEDVWQATRGECTVRQVVQYLPPKEGRVEQVISHLTIERSGSEEARTSTYTLRTYSHEEWFDLIARSCMEVVEVLSPWGEVMPQRDFGYMLFVLQPKRSVDQC